jgi:ERF superfamily
MKNVTNPPPATEQALATRPEQQVAAPSHSNSIMDVIARAAADPNVDVGKMERLYAMLKEEKASVARQEFMLAMSSAQAEIPFVIKKSNNPQTSSKYAKLEALAKAAAPVIEKHGFSLMFSEGDSANPAKIRIQCRVTHKGGHFEDFKIDLSPDDKGMKGNDSKTAIHGQGSTFSYGQRYLTKGIFNMIVIGEDDDGNQGQRPRSTTGRTATPATMMWFMEQTKDIHKQLLLYAIDKGWIDPNGTLESFPTQHCPTSKPELAKLRTEVEAHK